MKLRLTWQEFVICAIDHLLDAGKLSQESEDIKALFIKKRSDGEGDIAEYPDIVEFNLD